MNYVYLFAFAIYCGVLALITTIVYITKSSDHSFMLGNRSLNYVATAIAAHSSDMSIWLFMGLPGAIYAGQFATLWIPFGLIGGMYCAWTFIAEKLRTATDHYQSVTLSDYFERAFNDSTGFLRMASALIALIFFIFYISAGLVGMGVMFESVFQINYHIGILIGLLITVLYTLLGGFIGIAWCDLFQGLFLVAMILVVPYYGYQALANGITTIITTSKVQNALHSSLSIKTIMNALFVTISWGLGYFGQPHILINFMGINNAESTKKAKIVGMTWQILTLTASIAVGVIGIGLFTNNLANQELVFVNMVQTLFNSFSAGFILCAIIAAGLTTIDTQILVSASIFAEDIYKRFFNPTATTTETVNISKLGIIIIPLISYAIAFSKSNSVFGLVNYAWTGLGSAFGPLILISLYRQKTNPFGALLGMLSGGLIAALWPLINTTMPAMIPGFLSNVCITLLLSL